MKVKTLIPVLREKKRYLVFEVVSEEKITYDNAKKAIKKATKEFLGDYGLAKAGIIFLKDWKDNKGILRVSHKEVEKVKMSLALIKDINGKKIIIKSLGQSGIVDKARKKYLGGN